jgi:hypothetical protein
MGITKTDCTLLFFSKKELQVNFKKTLTLGKLDLYATKEDIEKCIKKYNLRIDGPENSLFPSEYAESLFKILGAQYIDSIDHSNYQGANIIHDLNHPIPEKFFNSYTCVVDSGTIEHVFNFPVAIKNCMHALKIGGHFIGMTPANNQMGHGFYQFSPEVYYRVFSEENGFKIKKMFIKSLDEKSDWYEVADPKNVKSRVTIVNSSPLTILFVAEKIIEKNIFATFPQQSDYTYAWKVFKSMSENKPVDSESRLRYYFRKFIPRRIKIILRNIDDIYRNEKVSSRELGVINTQHFKKVDI